MAAPAHTARSHGPWSAQPVAATSPGWYSGAPPTSVPPPSSHSHRRRLPSTRDCALTLLCCHPQSMPTMVTAAADVEISPLFLASATGSLLFIFLIVATIVTNFGIMKK